MFYPPLPGSEYCRRFDSRIVRLPFGWFSIILYHGARRCEKCLLLWCDSQLHLLRSPDTLFNWFLWLLEASCRSSLFPELVQLSLRSFDLSSLKAPILHPSSRQVRVLFWVNLIGIVYFSCPVTQVTTCIDYRNVFGQLRSSPAQLDLDELVLVRLFFDTIHCSFQHLSISFDLLLSLSHEFPIDLVPALGILRYVRLRLPVGHVSLDEVEPDFFVLSADLRRCDFDLSL